jgi:hypothetical protein
MILIAAAPDGAFAGTHGIGADAGYSSYLLPSVARGAGAGVSYRYLFIGDLGLRADFFISRHASLVADGKTVKPESVIMSGCLGLTYFVDLGPASPYVALGGSFHQGDLDLNTKQTIGYYMGVGVEFPLADPFTGAVEIDHFAQPAVGDAFPSYLLLVFRLTWVLGTPSETVSKI